MITHTLVSILTSSLLLCAAAVHVIAQPARILLLTQPAFHPTPVADNPGRYRYFQPPLGELFLSPLYAGRYEPRLGVLIDPDETRTRLDLGVSVNLLGWCNMEDSPMDYWVNAQLALGVDLFTWSRLNLKGGSGEEIVDLYVGVNGSWKPGADIPITDIRLRAGHIASYPLRPIADSLSVSSISYSRNMMDLMIATNTLALGLLRGYAGVEGESYPSSWKLLRPYLGAELALRSTPDSSSALTPYVGIDGHWQLTKTDRESSFGITLLAGWEARFHDESPTGHTARLGVKLAQWFRRGVTVEAAYHSGRSQFGQLFERQEEYVSIGVSIDHLVEDRYR